MKRKHFIIIIVLVVFLAAAKYFDFQGLLRQSLDWVAELGPWGPIAFVMIYIFACVFFIPGSLLTLGAGVLFGPVKGSLLVSVASTLGATCAFLVGRYFARGMVAKKTEGNAKFKAIDAAVAKEGWKIVGLTRLSPIFPFNLLNYAYGLTRVSLKDYFFASWIGMIPGTVMYVYIGSLAGNLANVSMGDRVRTPAEWTLYGVGLVATVLVSVQVTQVAKKALQTRIE